MGGITGFIDHNRSVTDSDLKQASAAIKHRGGNGSGFIYDEQQHYTLGLANERLTTVGLNENFQQPLTSHCGNYTITLSGAIYNYLELRETLIKYGVIFSTLTDAEVILECYKKWGNSAFTKLDGAYAFALLDRKLNQLLIARDEIGAKPMYYYKIPGFYAFASEIRALLSYPIVEKKINTDAIATYFRYGYFTGENTIYDSIFKHRKGTITTIDLFSGNSYDLPISKTKILLPEATTNEEEILTKVEELLTESILKRNVAEVPVGILLSGGYDSATVAAILQKNQSKRIKTFTVGFKDEKLNEAPQAKKIAEHLKTKHHEFYLGQNEALQLLMKLPEVFDEPVGDSSAIALLFIAEKVKKEIKVLLSATGGDELFGGYQSYVKALKLNAFNQNKMPKIFKNMIANVLKYTQPKLKEILDTDGLFDKYLEAKSCFTMAEMSRLLCHPANPCKPQTNKANNIKELLAYDLQNYLPNHILAKNDRCFMHHGVDNRDAILKTELVDYLATLDPQWFIKEGEQKYLLKKITNKYISPKLISKPKKDFEIPLANWLKTAFKPLVDKYLSTAYLNQHQLLNIQEVKRIKNKFYRNSSAYNAQKVWLLLQFQMWHERWMA